MSLYTRRSVLLGCAAMLAPLLGACTKERTADYYAAFGGNAGNSGTGAGDGALVGISMPTRSLERWIRDGDNLKSRLSELGYAVELQFADNEVDQQISQIETMAGKAPAVLIVAAIDGSALGPVLESASAKGIRIISYDRLIRDTSAVDYYVTFDNYRVGAMQGRYIVEALDLEHASGPFNFEPFAGSPDDNNARFYFEGAWDVLAPYIEASKLVCPSGKLPDSADGWQSIGIQAWSSTVAQAEMENRLSSFYHLGRRVDAILAPNDAVALGISQALASSGYGDGNWPVLTGQDADQANVANIVSGRQTMTVFKDTRLLGERSALMADQIIRGQDVEVNDVDSYDNGKLVVPSYLLNPVSVDRQNVQEVLVDSGYYSAAEIGL